MGEYYAYLSHFCKDISFSYHVGIIFLLKGVKLGSDGCITINTYYKKFFLGDFHE